MPVGQVIRAHSNIYYVLVEGRTIECRPRGRFRLDKQGVVVGDRVEVHIEGDEGRIDKVLERKTHLQRPAVANVDQALVVFTLKEPEADYPFLDRVLVHAEQAGVEVRILLNKTDLLAPEEVERFRRMYEEQVGYPVHPISAMTGAGVDELRSVLDGKVSVLAGHSGVGKSQLVRTLEPGRADVRVGEISRKLRRGKHTTRHVELIPISSGGLLVDAPGFTYLEFQGIEKWDLRDYFPEMVRLAADCRFDDCLHRKEPDCAVQEAVASGEIPRTRYDNYLFFLEEIEAQRKW